MDARNLIRHRFDILWKDISPADNNQVFFAAGNIDFTIRDVAIIAGQIPAIHKGFRSFVRAIVITSQHAVGMHSKLTYMPFIIRAVVDGLKHFPILNAAVRGTDIIFRKQINLGIAVALDWGLIVPVIRNADDLSLTGITRSLNDLAERARAKKLRPEEVQGGTFTITNPGGFGSVMGTPIINQPQVAILCIGTIEKRPKVVTGPDGEDTIAIRTCAYFSISFDHRIIDGAAADGFMAHVKRYMEQFPDGAL